MDVSTLAATNLAATTISIFYVHVQEDAHGKEDAYAPVFCPPPLAPPLSHSALKPTPIPPQNHTKEPQSQNSSAQTLQPRTYPPTRTAPSPLYNRILPDLSPSCHHHHCHPEAEHPKYELFHAKSRPEHLSRQKPAPRFRRQNIVSLIPSLWSKCLEIILLCGVRRFRMTFQNQKPATPGLAGHLHPGVRGIVMSVEG